MSVRGGEPDRPRDDEGPLLRDPPPPPGYVDPLAGPDGGTTDPDTAGPDPDTQAVPEEPGREVTGNSEEPAVAG